LHNPDYLLIRPFTDVGYLTERENNDIYQPTFFSYPLLPSWINEIALMDIDPKELMIGTVVISGLALAFLVARRNGFWLILTITTVLVYPHLVVSWQGDSAGLSRHTLLANLQVRLAVWMVLLAFMNEVFMRMNKFKKVKGSGDL
jgi:predicted cobalt transporter CbtA